MHRLAYAPERVVVEAHRRREADLGDARHVRVTKCALSHDVEHGLAHRRLLMESARDEDACVRAPEHVEERLVDEAMRSRAEAIEAHALHPRADGVGCVGDGRSDILRLVVLHDDEVLARANLQRGTREHRGGVSESTGMFQWQELEA